MKELCTGDRIKVNIVDGKLAVSANNMKSGPFAVGANRQHSARGLGARLSDQVGCINPKALHRGNEEVSNLILTYGPHGGHLQSEFSQVDRSAGGSAGNRETNQIQQGEALPFRHFTHGPSEHIHDMYSERDYF